ncbi:MAG: FAD-dependent oxidoreductase [bacterium]
MKNQYDVIIIGAGIGGLISGCYLVKYELKVLIVEQQKYPGGYCASFERNGYKFDVGVHYLGGVKTGFLNKILKELEIENTIKFIQHDPTEEIITPSHKLFIRTIPENTIEEFKKLFPNEKDHIEKFFKFIMKTSIISSYRKLFGMTFKDLLDNYFIDDNIKFIFSILTFINKGLQASEIAAISAIVLFQQHILDPGYYPSGGMQEFPNALTRYFNKLGGDILFSSKVTKILTYGNKIKGVCINNEDIIDAKIVISNVDARKTFKEFLNIKLKETKKVNKLESSASAFVLYLEMDKENIQKSPVSSFFF